MGGPPSDRCGYTWPEDHKVGDRPNHQSCCWRESVDGSDRCIWHVDSDEVSKTVDTLQEARAPPEIREQNSPMDELLDGAKLSKIELCDRISFETVSLRESDLSNTNLADAILVNADLTYSNLWHANLSRADLEQIDFSDADLERAELTDASLFRADFTDASLFGADLTDARLFSANFLDATLIHADLSSTDLQDVDLSSADLRETTITDVSVNGATTCKRLHEDSDFNSGDWDATARAYHDLKTTFNDHGLVGKARDMHVRERRARSLEAKSAGGILNRRYLGSLPARIFTGYGVRVRNLLFWMLLLFLIPTAIYAFAGVEETFLRNVSYSILAFTVAPPHIPSDPGVQLIMMIQTFLGTLSIVLLGYILGNRERF